MEISYYNYYKNCKSPLQIRSEMVEMTKKIGIKPTAKKFKTTVKTVKKWLKKVNQSKNKTKALEDNSRARKTQHAEMPTSCKRKILKYAEKTIKNNKRLKATYLKKDLKIDYSLKTILKFLRKKSILKTKISRKKNRKRDMRAIKEKLKVFQVIQIDIKYLDDIPEYYADYFKYKLPRYQITARDVKTGALYVCFAREKTVTNTSLFLNNLLNHLEKKRVNLKEITIQTDNGKEFTNGYFAKKRSLFTQIVEQRCKKQRLIPAGQCTYNSDVETSHRLIEDEFYAVKYFDSSADVLLKLKKYNYSFNLKRFNSYKQGTPRDLLDGTYADSVLKLAPIIIDEKINDLQIINKNLNYEKETKGDTL